MYTVCRLFPRASVCINKFNQIWRGVVEAIATSQDRESLIPLIQTKVHRMKGKQR